MSAYRSILAAIDLTHDSQPVAARACELARVSGGTVRLLHVIEFVVMDPLQDSLTPVMQTDEQSIDRARKRMLNLVEELGLPADAGCVEVGNSKSEILRVAREQGCDLIVLGARERHGLSILINRTEDTVLHGAPCDVLAVRTR